MKTIKTTYIRSAFLLAVIVMIIFSAACQKKNPLSSWTDNAQAKNDLIWMAAFLTKEPAWNSASRSAAENAAMVSKQIPDPSNWGLISTR